MSEPLLNIKNLTVEYRSDCETVHAVNDISFTLGKSETLGLVGETGAGKTTVALSIMGLLPDRVSHIPSGTIDFDGRNLLSLSEDSMRTIRGQEIAMIFQDPMTALDPVMSVGDQVREAIKLHNSDHKSAAEIDRRVDEVLQMVGITPSRKNEYPHQFSGGMKQRIVIAIALSCRPRLLIADEPTTALDVTIQAQVLSLMRKLKVELDTAMIMITHDLGIVAQTCDRVAVVYAGTILEIGTVEDIFTDGPKHPYTVGLFGSIPNLKERTRRLTPIGGLMPDPTKLPEGCLFSPRCPHCRGLCAAKKAPAGQVGGQHQICCWRYVDPERYAASPAKEVSADE